MLSFNNPQEQNQGLAFSNPKEQCAMVGFDLGIAYLARAASAKMR